MLNEERRINIKKAICRMEGDPEGVEIYLKTLRDSVDADEALAYAWEMIGRVYEEQAIMELESMGLCPPAEVPPDEDGETTEGGGEAAEGEGGSTEGDGDTDREGGETPSDNGDTGESQDGFPKDAQGNTNEEGLGEIFGANGDTLQEDAPMEGNGSDGTEGNTDSGLEKGIPQGKPDNSVDSVPVGQPAGVSEAKVEVTPQGAVLRLPLDAMHALKAGPVYVLPADTGAEAELRIMELRASTEENLQLARKIHEEIARSVAEEARIRENLHDLVQKFTKISEKVAESAGKAVEIRDSLAEGSARAERFVNDDMARMIQQRAQEATNEFYQESRDHYNELFRAAVKRYKQFTEAAMDFQDKMSDENARHVREIESKISMVEKVSYGICALLVVLLGLTVVFKIFS